MYCNNCGKKNPENSKFCKHCGVNLDKHNAEIKDPHTKRETISDYLTSNTSPYPYVISISKLIILSVATFGIYNIYWFYKHFKSFKDEDSWKVSPLLRAIFATLCSYSLFKRVSKKVDKLDGSMGFNPRGLAIFYFTLYLIPGWIESYWWVSLFAFLPLIPVQKAVNFYWKKKYHDKIMPSRFGGWNWIWMIAGGILIFSALYGSFDTSTITDTTDTSKNGQTSDYSQEEIVSSVVNIFCQSTVESEEGTGGSGTIITDDGIILTNSHIIPQDEEYINVDEQGCLVILPNPSTGQPEEMYWATPMVLPEISDIYDLAYLYIHDVYYDEETQEYQGTYPRTFPAFDDSNRCVDENVKLGEKVTIFGYPSLSGGYSLTVTDGLVSSFPGEGLIVTSAKISEGNSGGLAIDENGCMLGIPSMISYDETGSLGVIISSDLIYEFSDEVLKYLDQ